MRTVHVRHDKHRLALRSVYWLTRTAGPAPAPSNAQRPSECAMHYPCLWDGCRARFCCPPVRVLTLLPLYPALNQEAGD